MNIDERSPEFKSMFEQIDRPTEEEPGVWQAVVMSDQPGRWEWTMQSFGDLSVSRSGSWVCTPALVAAP